MKKNITINLFGALYAIDEDACNLLQQYLDNMKRYFSRCEGGDEIADDIEHRVAEIFSDLKAEGVEAISIEHVQEIIHRIGNPEELDADNENQGDAGTADDASAGTGHIPPEQPTDYDGKDAHERKSWSDRRKLFRDPDDKMLGGVMSGLSKYFGATDPLPWRIIMVLLAFFSVMSVGVIYIIAWALIPEAVTDEDRLRMRGIEVNPQTLNDNLLRKVRESEAAHNGPVHTGSNIFKTLFQIIVVLIKIFALCVLGFFILIILGCFYFAITAMVGGVSGVMLTEMFDADAMVLFGNRLFMSSLWIIGISAFVALGIGLYALLRSFLKRPGDKPMGNGARITLTVIALLSLATAISFTVIAALQSEHINRAQQNIEDNRNGYYMNRWDRNELAENNWEVKTYENGQRKGSVYHHIESLFEEGENFKYLKFEKGTDNKPMKVNLCRTQYYPKGDYRLEAIGYAKSYGAFLYVRTDSAMTALVSIPEDDFNGNGNLQHFTLDDMRTTAFASDSLTPECWEDYVKEHVKGWSYVASPTFHHAGGAITYGITNMGEAVGIKNSGAYPWKFGLYKMMIVPVKKAAAQAEVTGMKTAGKRSGRQPDQTHSQQ